MDDAPLSRSSQPSSRPDRPRRRFVRYTAAGLLMLGASGVTRSDPAADDVADATLPAATADDLGAIAE